MDYNASIVLVSVWFVLIDWLTDDLHDSASSISETAGAPDPTFSAMQGEKSQWQLSLDQLKTRFVADLESMDRFCLSSERTYVPVNFQCSYVG